MPIGERSITVMPEMQMGKGRLRELMESQKQSSSMLVDDAGTHSWSKNFCVFTDHSYYIFLTSLVLFGMTKNLNYCY